LLALIGRPFVRVLEDHGGGQVGDLAQPAIPVRGDRRVTGRCDDALVRGEQVIGIGVEVGDAADHRSTRDEVIALGQQLRYQSDVPGVALDEPVMGVIVVRLLDLPVLGEVVEAYHRVATFQQFFDDVPADETRGPADQNLLHYVSCRIYCSR
jgi:hypothetical protein